eukprot:s4332_g6.t1
MFQVNNLFKGWFKSAADHVKHAVSEHLFNIYMVLIYTRVIKAPSKDPQCRTHGNMAYVRNSCPQKTLPYLQSNPCGERYPFSQPKLYVIHICPITWQSPSLFHVGNIIHEASHHYGTKDLAYGMKPCLDLATAQAVSNADQYVYFVQHLMALKYPEKIMRSYRGSGKGDHEFDLKIFSKSPHFCCWSAHLFCKLPGDPTAQPWHQDAGFWPLSESRAVTLWLAFDDTDEVNGAVRFVKGSHRLGRLPWQPTSANRHLLTQEIPDVDLLGEEVCAALTAGRASIHSDLTVHGSPGNFSERRRAGLALRFVGCDASCLGAMINGYEMNRAVILPKGPKSDPRGHWRSLKRRSGARQRSRMSQVSATEQPVT